MEPPHGLHGSGNRMRMGCRDLTAPTEIFSVDPKKQNAGLSHTSPEAMEAFSLTMLSLPSGGI